MSVPCGRMGRMSEESRPEPELVDHPDVPEYPEYAERVLDVAERIPPGRVMSYGDVAEWLEEGGPRQVGRVMSLDSGGMPWWRVVRADGGLPDCHGGEALSHHRAEGTPLRSSGRVDMAVGIVIGAFIFQAPSMVAANTSAPWQFVSLWVLGGVISLIGALCYAELAATYPDCGGDYHFLKTTYGRSVAFLFAWARVTVIGTGPAFAQTPAAPTDAAPPQRGSRSNFGAEPTDPCEPRF